MPSNTRPGCQMSSSLGQQHCSKEGLCSRDFLSRSATAEAAHGATGTSGGGGCETPRMALSRREDVTMSALHLSKYSAGKVEHREPGLPGLQRDLSQQTEPTPNNKNKTSTTLFCRKVLKHRMRGLAFMKSKER